MKTKVCFKCKKEKLLSNFYKKPDSKDGRHSYCKECDRKRLKSFYQENKESENARIKKYIDDKKSWVRKYLKNHPCVDCGFSDIRALDFGHIRGKKRASISRLYSHSWENIKKEIEKCEVRCANCHRIVTAERAGW